VKYDPRIKCSDSEPAFVRRYCWEICHQFKGPDSIV
jgi:hypothetical protein